MSFLKYSVYKICKWWYNRVYKGDINGNNESKECSVNMIDLFVAVRLLKKEMKGNVKR